MKSFDILGSCVTRDAFVFADNNLKLNNYFARSSLISIYSPPARVKIDEIKLSSNFQKRMVYFDLTKYFKKYINDSKSDFIIIDFIDERIPLMKRHDSFITRSKEFVDSKINDVINYASAISIEEDKIDYWKKSALNLIKDLKGKFPASNVILHKAFWKETYIDENGEIKKFQELDQIVKNNKILEQYYDFFENNFKEISVIDISQKYNADSKHKWGISPFHYEINYYKEFINLINHYVNFEDNLPI